MTRLIPLVACITLVIPATVTLAQDNARPSQEPPRRDARGPGMMGMNREEIKLVKDHDLDDNGWLDREERSTARAALSEMRSGNGEGRGGMRPGRRRSGGEREPVSPGPRMDPNDVTVYESASLYDPLAFRTIFLTFENEDWEKELQEFHGTDVEVPAMMLVDGEDYPNVGVRFRGASSYMMVPEGHKRSFNISLDLADKDQRLLGYKTLNLLNSNGDVSMMSSVIYSSLADPHLAVPKANFVKVVVNGEYWGVYVNVQQFDKIFTKENYGSSKGTRWKVPGSPRGDGGLAYLGEDLEPYKARYDMKSNDGEKAWRALVELCKVINETPLDQLVEELSPLLDIDEALWFLAYDVTFVNSDGFWTRASDYSLFRDRNGQFHIIPHDMNEAFKSGGRARGGPGGPPNRAGQEPPRDDRRRRGPGGGPGHGGVDLDPLIGLDSERMALRSRLLAVPELRERYLEYVRQIAEQDLDWSTLGPKILAYRTLIDDAVEMDSRKLSSLEAFRNATAYSADGEDIREGSMHDFAVRRRAYLLKESAPESDDE